MTLLGRVVEPCNLAHCECNVRASVCGQVEKHSDDRWVAPLLIHGFTIRIDSKCSGSTRNPVWVAICHCCHCKNFLDESLLHCSDCTSLFVMNKLDAKKFRKGSLVSQLKATLCKPVNQLIDVMFILCTHSCIIDIQNNQHVWLDQKA